MIKKFSEWCKQIKKIIDTIINNDIEKSILNKWILNLIIEKMKKNWYSEKNQPEQSEEKNEIGYDSENSVYMDPSWLTGV